MHAAIRSLVFSLSLYAICVSVNAASVDSLLAAGQAPVGVVIEIVEGDTEALVWALPEVRKISEQLRARFPELPIAVVTHGQEQFGLLSAQKASLAPIHTAAQAMVEADIGLHVCGAHAGWYGHTPEDFPDYVDVSPSGPAQINDYVALGFTLIRL